MIIKYCDCGRYYVRGKWLFPEEMQDFDKISFAKFYTRGIKKEEIKITCPACLKKA